MNSHIIKLWLLKNLQNVKIINATQMFTKKREKENKIVFTSQQPNRSTHFLLPRILGGPQAPLQEHVFHKRLSEEIGNAAVQSK